MSYVIEATEWLSNEISQDVKVLLGRYYELADSTQSDAGSLMATDIFSAEALVIGPNGTLRGSKEIADSRGKPRPAVKSTKHTISKVFSAQNNSELVLIGAVHMDLVNGKGVDCPFSTLVKLETPTDETRISFMEVFADVSPISAAFASK